MKRLLVLLTVTTSAFDPGIRGCKYFWKAYSPNGTLNDKERESVIEVIGETHYFCDYERLASDIRNILTAVVKGRIPNCVDASLAKVFLGLRDNIEIIDYDVEIIQKENLKAELRKFVEQDFVGCALGSLVQKQPEGSGFGPAPAKPKQPAKRKKSKKNRKKKHSKRKMRMPTVKKIQRPRENQPKKKNPPKKKKHSKKTNGKRRGKNQKPSPPKPSPSKPLPPPKPLPTEDLMYYVCVYSSKQIFGRE